MISWSQPLFYSLILFLAASTSFNTAFAEAVGPNAFSQTAYLQDFEQLPFGNYSSPLILDGVSFDGGDDGVRISSKFGISLTGEEDEALQTNPINDSNPELRVTLSRAKEKVGLYVGAEFPWIVSAQFLDTNNALLGNVELSGSGRDGKFAGWESDGNPIVSIVLKNLLSGPNNPGAGVNPLTIDKLITQVPEPASLLSVVALFCNISLRRSR